MGLRHGRTPLPASLFDTPSAGAWPDASMAIGASNGAKRMARRLQREHRQSDLITTVPPGSWVLVKTGAELQQQLMQPVPALKYLRLDKSHGVYQLTGDALAMPVGSMAYIHCADAILDMQRLHTFTVNSNTELQFYSCQFFAPDSTAAWAHRAIFKNSQIVHPCAQASDPSLPETVDSGSDGSSLRGRPLPLQHVNVDIGEHTALWVNSTAICLDQEVIDSTVADLTQHQAEGAHGFPLWAMIVVGCALLVIAAVVSLVLRWCVWRTGRDRTKLPPPSSKTLSSAFLDSNLTRWSRIPSALASEPVKQHTSPSSGSSTQLPCPHMIAIAHMGNSAADVNMLPTMPRVAASSAAAPLPTTSDSAVDSSSQRAGGNGSRPASSTETTAPGGAQNLSKQKTDSAADSQPVGSGNRPPPAPRAPEQQPLTINGAREHLDMLEPIGSGGYGNVYRAIWKGLEVAVKTVLFQAMGGPTSQKVQRVFAEAAIACNMAHPHIVNTFAHELQHIQMQREGELRDYKLYLIQEFCVGGSLSKLIRGGHLGTAAGGVHMTRVLTILRHVASGMAHMHKQRMVHGDLNPANILLQLECGRKRLSSELRVPWRPSGAEKAKALDSGQCVVKLTDFGLTEQLQQGRTHVSNARRGTPFYSAPELDDKRRLHRESDLYSFGVIMWELYSNEAPYVQRHGTFLPHPDLGKFPPFTPLNYGLLAVACCAPAPDERPSFDAVLEILNSIDVELASGYYTDLFGMTQSTSLLTRKCDLTRISASSFSKSLTREKFGDSPLAPSRTGQSVVDDITFYSAVTNLEVTNVEAPSGDVTHTTQLSQPGD